MSNAGRTLLWRCAGPVPQCWRQPSASAGSRPTSNYRHCGRRWHLTKPIMPPVTPWNRLPRPRNLLNRQMPAEQISIEAGTIPRSLSAIGIGRDDDASFGGEVQIPELVTSRQRGHEQLFRVPARSVSSKGRVGGALNGGFAVRDDLVIAGIVSIPRGAGAEITVPGKRHRIPMLARVCHERLRQIALPFDRQLGMLPAADNSRVALFKWGLGCQRSSSSVERPRCVARSALCGANDPCAGDNCESDKSGDGGEPSAGCCQSACAGPATRRERLGKSGNSRRSLTAPKVAALRLGAKPKLN